MHSSINDNKKYLCKVNFQSFQIVLALPSSHEPLSGRARVQKICKHLTNHITISTKLYLLCILLYNHTIVHLAIILYLKHFKHIYPFGKQ